MYSVKISQHRRTSSVAAMWLLSVLGFALVNVALSRTITYHYNINEGGQGGNSGGGSPGSQESSSGENGGSVLSDNLSVNEKQNVLKDLQSRSPRVQIKDNNGQNVITVPTEVLYSFLKDQGLSLPPIEDIPGFTSDKPHTHKYITIYPNQLFIILSNKDAFSKANPALISVVLRTPNAGHPVIPGTNGLTLTVTISPDQQKKIKQDLENTNHVKVHKGTVTITVNSLLKFLRKQGVKVPSLSDLGLSPDDGDTTLHINFDTILSIISNKLQATKDDLINIIKTLIKNNGSLGIKGGVEITGNGKLGGNCNKHGFVQKATSATGGVLNKGLGAAKNVVQGVANKIPLVGGLISKAEGIKSGALMDFVNGAKKTIDAAGCGVGDVANQLANGIASGDVLGGIENGVKALGKGVGKTANEAVNGVKNILNNAANGLTGGGDSKNGGGGGLFGGLFKGR